MRLPSAKITQIKEFTPAAWVKTHARQKTLPQAAWIESQLAEPLRRFSAFAKQAGC
jgi:hypothetical protein